MRLSDLGGQVVLSLSRTRARMVVFLTGEDVLGRCGPRGTGRARMVGIVRCGRSAVGCFRSRETVRRKAGRFKLEEEPVEGMVGCIGTYARETLLGKQNFMYRNIPESVRLG